MATTFWNGSTGDPNSDSNYTGNAPSDGDTMIVDGALSQQAITESFTYCINLALLVVKNFPADIGASGNPFTNFTADKMIILSTAGSANTGTTYIDPYDDLSSDHLDELIVNSDNLTDALVLSGTAGTNTTILRNAKGGITIDVTANLTNLIMSYRSNPGTDARVTIPISAGKTITSILVDAGILANSRAVTDAIQNGGSYTQSEEDVSGTLTVCDGTMIYNGTAQTDTRALGGTLTHNESRDEKT